MAIPTPASTLDSPSHSTLHNTYIDATMFDVTGDGVADDTAELQAAITQAGVEGATVIIPPGSYKVTSTITVPSFVRVMGTSKEDCILLHRAGSNPLFQVNYVSQHVAFEHFKIEGDPTGSGTGHGIYLAGATGGSSYITQTRIHDVQFISVGDATHWAIKMIWALETYISNVHILGSLGGGIHVGDTSNASVIRDSTLSNGAHGALGAILVEANGLVVEGTVIESWRGSYGIKVTGGNQFLSLIGVWFEDNYGDDIQVGASSSVTISGCNTSEGSAGSYPNALANIAGSSTERTYINIVSSSLFGTVKFRNGTNDMLQIVSSNSILSNAGSWTGDVDTTGITTPANFSFIRINDRRDRFNDPQGMIEAAGIGSGIRLEESNLWFGTSSDSGAVPGDTNLYRSAANVLKTDDKMVAALGIGVGNSAAATTPGAVVKKMEVFDASGASLGFVPIYSSIT